MGVSRMGRVSRWSPEFREEAVRLHRESGESIAAVARRLGVGPETMRRWVRDTEVERGERDGVTVAEQAEIRELRRQVRRLEEEKLILQKAAAYFARETGQLP
jgi:transposase